MGIQNKEHILGSAYKRWYHEQPKLLKVVGIPFLITLSVIIIKYKKLDDLWLFVPAILLFINLYNQYLDTLLSEDLDEKLDNMENKMMTWRASAENLLYLNNIFNELVENKSSMFLHSAKKAIDGQRDEGIRDIRDSGSLKNSLDRIVTIIYKVFEKYANIEKNQKFRVCYLVPSTDGVRERLVAKSWFNIDKIPPLSVSTPNEAFFSKGDTTAAGYLWARNGQKSILIDNVEIKSGKNDIFAYTHPEQASYLKSIYCYKVMNFHECIGIICVDTNVADTLSKNEQFYENALESFSKRIVFETRCAYMKSVLSREAN